MGAGHVAKEVSWLADRNGFQVHIIDPRQELMQAEHFPDSCTLSVQQSVPFLTEEKLLFKDFIIIAGPDQQRILPFCSRQFKLLRTILE